MKTVQDQILFVLKPIQICGGSSFTTYNSDDQKLFLKWVFSFSSKFVIVIRSLISVKSWFFSFIFHLLILGSLISWMGNFSDLICAWTRTKKSLSSKCLIKCLREEWSPREVCGIVCPLFNASWVWKRGLFKWFLIGFVWLI